jgi:FHA domain-containing protein
MAPGSRAILGVEPTPISPPRRTARPMNPLKSVETMIASLVEGTFGRLFRTEVRPMELARKLAREMDAHRTVSVSRVYVPNEYSVWLSRSDRARYEGVEHEVIDELCAYLLEHARRENLILASPPHISFHTDERLSLGEFGIQARLVPAGEDEPAPSPSPRAAPAPPASEQHGQTMIYSNAARVREAVEEVHAQRPPERVLLAVGGRRLLVPPGGGTVGRSRDCDVVLEDAGVSRRHAELRPGSDGWTVADLGSTNGVRVNGTQVRGVQLLRSGDLLELGSTEIVFEVS